MSFRSKQRRRFILTCAVAWIAVIVVGLVFGLPGWSEETVRLPWLWLELVVSALLIAVALVLYSSLRYVIPWTLVLIALAIAGTGIDIPVWFVLFPDRLWGRGMASAFFTLLAVVVFSVCERMIDIYIGRDLSDRNQSLAFESDDELVELKIDTKHRYAETSDRD